MRCPIVVVLDSRGVGALETALGQARDVVHRQRVEAAAEIEDLLLEILALPSSNTVPG